MCEVHQSKSPTDLSRSCALYALACSLRCRPARAHAVSPCTCPRQVEAEDKARRKHRQVTSKTFSKEQQEEEQQQLPSGRSARRPTAVKRPGRDSPSSEDGGEEEQEQEKEEEEEEEARLARSKSSKSAAVRGNESSSKVAGAPQQPTSSPAAPRKAGRAAAAEADGGRPGGGASPPGGPSSRPPSSSRTARPGESSAPSRPAASPSRTARPGDSSARLPADEDGAGGPPSIVIEDPEAAYLVVATEAYLRLYEAAAAVRGARGAARKVALPGRLRFASAFAAGGAPALVCLMDMGGKDHIQVRAFVFGEREVWGGVV